MDSTIDDPVRELAELLREAKAVPRLSPKRMVRSAFYDPVYRAWVIGFAVRECGKQVTSEWMLSDQLLRLYQFVAVHRALLKPLQEWVAARRAGTLVPLNEWTGFPGGYATDTIHDEVMTYLQATGQLRRDGTSIVLPEIPAKTFLLSLLYKVDSAGLFSAERAALAELKQLKLKLNMLEV